VGIDLLVKTSRKPAKYINNCFQVADSWDSGEKEKPKW
jgi:hypothetical protein